MFYQQPYQQYQQYAQPVQPRIVDDRIWVQSEAAAESYLVAPNSTVILWDTMRPVIYIKKADVNGRPFPLDVYEYKKTENQKSEYKDPVSESRTDSLEKKMNSLEERIKMLEGRCDEQSDADDTAV